MQISSSEGGESLCGIPFIQFLENEGMLCVTLDESGELVPLLRG